LRPAPRAESAWARIRLDSIVYIVESSLSLDRLIVKMATNRPDEVKVCQAERATCPHAALPPPGKKRKRFEHRLSASPTAAIQII
jgi:hypothetical protein